MKKTNHNKRYFSEVMFAKILKVFYSLLVIFFGVVFAYIYPEYIHRIYVLMAICTVSLIFVNYLVKYDNDEALTFHIRVLAVMSMCICVLLLISLRANNFNWITTITSMGILYIPALYVQIITTDNEGWEDQSDSERYLPNYSEQINLFAYFFYNVFLTVLPFWCISKLFQDGFSEFRAFTLFSYCFLFFILFIDGYGRKNWESSFFWKSHT